MKDCYQFDLFNLPETLLTVATGLFGFLAYLGTLFLLFVFIDFISPTPPFDALTWGILLISLIGTVIGWLGLYYLNKLRKLKIRKCSDRNSYFLA